MINPRASILVIISCSALGIMVVTNYLTFEQSAFAVDNCDSSSNCTNTQTGIDNTQTNDCTNFSTCRMMQPGMTIRRPTVVIQFTGTEFSPGCENVAEGNGNSQTNTCDSDPGNGCTNEAFGNDNTQNIDSRMFQSLGVSILVTMAMYRTFTAIQLEV